MEELNNLKYVDAVMSDDNIQYLVGSKKIEKITLKPYCDIICLFLSEFSKKLNSSSEVKNYPDLKALSFWCRKNNLFKLRKNFQSSNFINRVALGIIFHITPSNVPTNFAYSLIFGLLNGNTNIVKIPSKNFPQIKVVCKILNQILRHKKYFKIKKMIKIIRYEHNEIISENISKLSNARLIWGSDKTINELKKISATERTRDITFPDRFSLCLLNTDKILKLDDYRFNTLINNFYNDTYLVDQNACSSPHLILWQGKRINDAKKKFWEKLCQKVKSRYKIEESAIMEKFTKLYSDIIKLKNIKNIKNYENLVHTVFLKKLDVNLHNYKSRWGFFYQYNIKDLSEIKNYVNLKYQTLTYFGFEKQKLNKIVQENGFNGIDRIVPVGRSLDMDIIWDGYEINSFLTRTIEIR